MEIWRDKILGAYAIGVDLPVSHAARRFQACSRKVRRKSDPFVQKTILPRVSWRAVFPAGSIRIAEQRKENGNVRLAEVGVLCLAARCCPEGETVLEIGTFDGRTTLNLALNAPTACPIHTLDLPPAQETVFSLEPGERHFVEKAEPGLRYRDCAAEHRPFARRITQLLGDSGAFDFSGYRGRCGLVFVDGSHAYDYALKDTYTALELVSPAGTILWHDYGVWQGVTRALEEVEAAQGLGLCHIRGTSLVVLRPWGTTSRSENRDRTGEKNKRMTKERPEAREC